MAPISSGAHPDETTVLGAITMYIETSSQRTRSKTCCRRRSRKKQLPPDLKELLEETVTRVFDVELDHIRMPTRGRARVAIARQVAMYLAHVSCGLSLTETGELFGRDRTTVSHACQVVEDRREDPEFDRALQLLENITKILPFCLPAAPAPEEDEELWDA